MQQQRIDRLNNLGNVLNRIYNSLLKRENNKNFNYFTVENTVKIDDGYINILFPYYIHGYSGVRDAITGLNSLHNSNSGDGLALIYSHTQSAFYLIYKNLQSFIDATCTIHEELKKLYTSQMYALLDQQQQKEENEPQ